jgi:hypothetical protein
MGFEHFYGFVGGDTSQWQPNLFNDTKAIYPYVGNPQWNLTTAIADDAIHWLNQLNYINPEMPSFLSFSHQFIRRLGQTPGATSHQRRSIVMGSLEGEATPTWSGAYCFSVSTANSTCSSVSALTQTIVSPLRIYGANESQNCRGSPGSEMRRRALAPSSTGSVRLRSAS